MQSEGAYKGDCVGSGAFWYMQSTSLTARFMALYVAWQHKHTYVFEQTHFVGFLTMASTGS